MRILMITATDLEMKALGTLPTGIDCRVTGVGVPSTIYQLQKTLNNQPYDLVIQAGIAGSFRDDLPLGSVVKVESDCFADLGIKENRQYHPLLKTHLAEEADIFYPQSPILNQGQFYSQLALPAVRGITVNLVTDDPAHNKMMENAFSADIESMEGAGLHFVCTMRDIDFLQVRAISNRVGERDKGKWKIETALDALGARLASMFAIG